MNDAAMIGYKIFAVRDNVLQFLYINYLYPLKYYNLKPVKEYEWLTEEEYCPEQIRLSRNIKHRGFHLFSSIESCLYYLSVTPKLFGNADKLIVYEVEYDNIIFERDGNIQAYCIKLNNHF